jgi:hypothetical protein
MKQTIQIFSKKKRKSLFRSEKKTLIFVASFDYIVFYCFKSLKHHNTKLTYN